jgi:signal transduction histidine kinase/ligand-binding sensor domain-containing protein/CheY-like chemotaxis protein
MGRTALFRVLLLQAAAMLVWGGPDSTVSRPETSWAALSGAHPEIRFQALTRADGVPAKQFYHMLQDKRGFIWFATRDGLVRYDGYRSVTYPGLPMTRIPPKTQAVPGRLFEDRQGSLWVVTDVLTRFDPSTGKFGEAINPRQGPLRPGVDFISAVHDAPGGSLWVAVYSYQTDRVFWSDISDPVLYEVKPATGAGIRHRIPDSIAQGKPLAIRAIEEDARGRVWLGTSAGLIRFDPKSEAFHHYPHVHPDDNVDEQKRFNGLAWDRTGHLWIHMPAGLERFDPESGTFDRFTAARFWNMSPDPGGRIWLWGEYPGLKVFDPSAPAERALKTVFFPTSSGREPDDPVVVALAPDRQSSMWAYLASSPDVYRYSPAAAEFGMHVPESNNPDSPGSGLVLGFSEARDGAMWVLHGTGLDRFDPGSGAFRHYKVGLKDAQGNEQGVASIYEDRSGVFWLGADDGLLGVFDPRSGRPVRYRAVLKRQITSMFEDSSGRFWVGARLGPVYLFDRRAQKITNADFRGGYVTFEDRAGNLWFGSQPGVNKLDRQGRVRMIALRQPDAAHPAPTVVTSIHEDAGGLLWLSSSRGVYSLDPRSEKVTPYGVPEGLASEDVRCMLPDAEGNLWMSTDSGISRFDRRAKLFYNYEKRDGLQGAEFTHFACRAARDGRLYFGGHGGFNAFFPRDVLAREAEPSVVLTSLQINHKDAPIIGVSALRLAPRQNELTFEFAVLNATNPGKFRYRFKLDGLEKQWLDADNEHRQARYTELAPGTYTFRAEASSDGRTWHGKNAALPVTILPPWWRTWWAETLGALVFAGLLAAIHRIRVSALHRRQRALAALVEQRTAELVEARDHAQHGRDQAEAANQAKSVFLAHMSHELRNPLSSILGIASLLREEVASGEQREYVEMIDRSGEHLLSIINDVLDMAKIESGKEEVAAVPFDVVVLAREIVEMMRVKADAKKLALVHRYAPDIRRYVRADAAKLRQVLVNLLGNAIKFTDAGGVTLRMSAGPADDASRLQLRFEVEDTGIGIAPEDQARIFEPFVQAAGRTRQKGTGLGLAITRKLVTIMGGAVTVRSAPGKGSCFTVEIPAAVAAAEELPGARSDADSAYALAEGQPQCRVLVVEDEPENALIMEQMLSRAGFQVRVVESGAKGIEVFEAWRPHFVWMDLRMPEMSGTETARRIRELPEGGNVKIAAMTASAFESERAQVLAAGMDDFVRKPFRAGEVFGCMGRLLGVQYQQAREPRSVGREQVLLRPQALETLPAGLRRELADAVAALNRPRIAAAIAEVAEIDPAVAESLRGMHDRLAYSAMLAMMEPSPADSHSGAAKARPES